MEMYECITRIMELSGMTFDETFTYFTVALIGIISGFSFFLCLFFDLGRCLYRVVKDLLRSILRRFRHSEEEEP